MTLKVIQQQECLLENHIKSEIEMTRMHPVHSIHNDDSKVVLK